MEVNKKGLDQQEELKVFANCKDKLDGLTMRPVISGRKTQG